MTGRWASRWHLTEAPLTGEEGCGAVSERPLQQLVELRLRLVSDRPRQRCAPGWEIPASTATSGEWLFCLGV